ncbi:MAG: hypothetical protein ACYCZR_01970 [Burkholderiales bacterium]
MGNNTSDHTLLTAQEAAALLQPYIPNKSALNWLAHDRLRGPIIPFILLQGEAYYREGDLIFIITRMLDSEARFVRVNNRLYADHRNVHERRSDERRKRENVLLGLGIERRQEGKFDHRLNTRNRRTHPQ